MNPSTETVLGTILYETPIDAERALARMGFKDIEIKKNVDYTWTVSYVRQNGLKEQHVLKGDELV